MPNAKISFDLVSVFLSRLLARAWSHVASAGEDSSSFKCLTHQLCPGEKTSVTSEAYIQVCDGSCGRQPGLCSTDIVNTGLIELIVSDLTHNGEDPTRRVSGAVYCYRGKV